MLHEPSGSTAAAKPCQDLRELPTSSPSWRQGPENDRPLAAHPLRRFVAQYPDIGYGYVVEVKYLKRSERVDESVVGETLRGARAQLAGYLADAGLRRLASSVRHVGLAVVFHGWELAACEAVKPEAGNGGEGPP